MSTTRRRSRPVLAVVLVGVAAIALASDVGAAPRAVSRNNPRERAAALALPASDATLSGAARVAIEARCLAVVAAAVPVSAGAPQIVSWRRGEFPGRSIALVKTTDASIGSVGVSGYRITVTDAGARCRVIAVVASAIER